jgi:hypothetical protein
VHINPRTKVSVSPVQMRHVFGDPVWNFNETTTGAFIFEDTNLDLFLVAEPNSTTATRGLNKDDRYYLEKAKTIDKARREHKRLSADEFWDSEEQRVFYIFTTPDAHHVRFRVWLQKALEEGIKEPSFLERAKAKYGDLFNQMNDYDQDYTKYKERGKEHVAAFNFK